MSIRSFRRRLLEHLADYRRTVLGISEPGRFQYRGRELAVEHVLPEDQLWLNVPDWGRRRVQDYVQRYKIHLHQYFHHLNSSQAFALSLFVPLFEGGEEASTALLGALGQGERLADWEAEAVPDRVEESNLDVWWRSTEGHDTICEVKLTEEDFGDATADEDHMFKLDTIYAPRLRGIVDAGLLEPERFFGAYQIMRNLWHAAKDDSTRVIFLYPEANAALTRHLEPVLQETSAELRARVSVVHIEDVLRRLAANPQLSEEYRAYAMALERKYVPGAL